MRRDAALRTISRQQGGAKSVQTAKPVQGESLPVTAFERNILATLNEMERMMEGTLQRPFFGINTMPLRHLLQRGGGLGSVMPSLDIYEDKGEVIVKAELPGLKREDVSVKLINQALVISGENKSEERVERKDFLRMERSHGTFSRTVNLPEGVDTEHVRASLKDGVLEVRFRRSGSGGGRQIEVE